MNKKPRIVSAACKKDNIILAGARHFDMVMVSQIEAMDCDMGYFADAIQGFIDQYGDFHTREEAMVIARKNNQLIAQIGKAEILFSEDLY